MRKATLSLLFTLLCLFTEAQTYTSNAGGSIPDAGAMVQFPLTVSGLSPNNIDTTFGLETVCFTITHTWDADLHISLQAPDGSIVDLSISNGGSGDNYTNTCLNASAANSIVTASAPFTGTFRPQGFIGAFNNGQNGNGNWTLLVQDVAGQDTGSVITWSLTFGNNPAHPFLFTSSNLPIVVINTNNQNIPDSPNIIAHMGIIYNGIGARNYLTDPFNDYNNKIAIQIRGSSSQMFPQKSYGFETLDTGGIQKDTMILGMPIENDWILYAPYDDKTCMRDVLTYSIANQTGHYASRCKFCELLINGQYQGIYVMMEKIKRDANRVNISKLTTLDTVGSALTGGYIIKIDKTTGNGGAGWNSLFPTSVGSNIYFQYDYPSDVNILPVQKTYIQNYVDSFETVLSGNNFNDLLNGYRKYIDVNSFIDYFILNEVSKNVDGYRLSTYLFKYKITHGGKLVAGPAWDYNLAWWNANYCDGNLFTGWAYQFNSVCSGDQWEVPFWWDRLMQDPIYVADLKCRWTQLRQTTLSLNSIDTFIDSVANYLTEATVRHFQAWPILGAYTWPNPSPIPSDYSAEIIAMKDWIQSRIAWIDTNLPGVCTVGMNNQITSSSIRLFPNPFTNSFQIDFYLPHSEKIKINITDVYGREIKSIDEKEFREGDNSIELNFGENNLTSGVYFVTLSTPTYSIVKKTTKL